MKAKLKAHWVVRLNDEAKLHVAEGNVVEKGDRIVTIQTKNVKVFNNQELLKFQSSVWSHINQTFTGKYLNQGDSIFTTKGLFPVRVKAPSSGLFLGVDEFGGMHMEIEGQQDKEISSPVKAVISKIDGDKIVLEFEAIEFKGEGLTEGKVWGESDFKNIERLPELSYKHNGQIILSDDFNQTFLTKAEVLGVNGIVTSTKDKGFDKMETSLPVLMIDEDNWSELSQYSGEVRQVLINTKLGRLLIVVE